MSYAMKTYINIKLTLGRLRQPKEYHYFGNKLFLNAIVRILKQLKAVKGLWLDFINDQYACIQYNIMIALYVSVILCDGVHSVTVISMHGQYECIHYNFKCNIMIALYVSDTL